MVRVEETSLAVDHEVRVVSSDSDIEVQQLYIEESPLIGQVQNEESLVKVEDEESSLIADHEVMVNSSDSDQSDIKGRKAKVLGADSNPPKVSFWIAFVQQTLLVSIFTFSYPTMNKYTEYFGSTQNVITGVSFVAAGAGTCSRTNLLFMSTTFFKKHFL